MNAVWLFQMSDILILLALKIAIAHRAEAKIAILYVENC